MSPRRLRSISSSTLRAWMRALNGCPSYVPLVKDLRIAVYNELRLREHEAWATSAWLLEAIGGVQ
jgi:hypothetical protein